MLPVTSYGVTDNVKTTLPVTSCSATDTAKTTLPVTYYNATDTATTMLPVTSYSATVCKLCYQLPLTAQQTLQKQRYQPALTV